MSAAKSERTKAAEADVAVSLDNLRNALANAGVLNPLTVAVAVGGLIDAKIALALSKPVDRQ